MIYNCKAPEVVEPHECAPREDAPHSIWCGYCLKKIDPEARLNVGFAFPWGGGGKAGKAEFHGPTLRERQERQIAEAKAAGCDPVPVGTRWV